MQGVIVNLDKATGQQDVIENMTASMKRDKPKEHLASLVWIAKDLQNADADDAEDDTDDEGAVTAGWPHKRSWKQAQPMKMKKYYHCKQHTMNSKNSAMMTCSQYFSSASLLNRHKL